MEIIKKLLDKKYTPTTGNTSLLLMVFFTIFIIPLFPVGLHRVLYNLAFTAIFFMAIFSVESKRGIILWIAVIATITEWLAAYLDLRFLIIMSYGTNVVFFAVVVLKMIIEIAKTKKVTVRVIVEAINCYLLIGFIFGLLVTFVVIFDTNAYNFTWIKDLDWQEVSHVSEYFYYTFVTFTTLGYGDIVPQTPAARSLAILISVTGQIYIAIIIALLVGKYASTQND
jgi:hypothetical protein